MIRASRTLALSAAFSAVATLGLAAVLSTGGDDGLGSGVAASSSAALGTGSLTTLFAQNNGFRGNTFDLEAAVCLEIVGWDFNFTNGAGVTGDISIWSRVGTSVGFESDPLGWTLMGTLPVTTAGNNLPTHSDIGGLVIQPGEIFGIYYYSDDYPNPRTGYTNGGPMPYSNAELTLTTQKGIGTTTPFGAGGVFTSRQVNTTVHYSTATEACNPSDGGDKTKLCHVPQGNPENAHVIEVGAPAVDPHLEEHGDCLVSRDLEKGDACSCP